MRGYRKAALMFLAFTVLTRASLGRSGEEYDDDNDDDDEGEESIVKFRGVDPNDLDLYLGKTFKCPGNDKEIPIEYVNDNYCDCPPVEGQTVTDEPGTGACSNGVFYCKDSSLKDVRLKPSQVNDGFCDCCDGSDEWDNEDVRCEYTCGNMGKELIDREREHLVKIRKYMREKKHLGDTAAKDLPKFVREYKNAKAKIANQEAKIKEFNQQEKDKLAALKTLEDGFAETAKNKKATTTPNLDVESM